jgi:hypothetical protein
VTCRQVHQIVEQSDEERFVRLCVKHFCPTYSVTRVGSRDVELCPLCGRQVRSIVIFDRERGAASEEFRACPS